MVLKHSDQNCEFSTELTDLEPSSRPIQGLAPLVFHQSEKWFFNTLAKKMCIFQLIWQNHQADPSEGLAATISIRKWFVNIPTKAVENLEAMDWFLFCAFLSPSLSLSQNPLRTHAPSLLSLLLYMAVSSDKSQTRWGALFRNLKALTHHSRFARPGVRLFPTPPWGATKFFGFLVTDMTTSLFTSRRPTEVDFNSPVQVLSHCLFCNNPFAWSAFGVCPFFSFSWHG